VALIRPRLLALRALGLGDLLTGVPALRALRRAHPDHELVLAAPAVLSDLVRLADVADRVLPTAGLEPVPWTGVAPAVAVNLHGRGPQSHRLLQDLRSGRLVAFGCREAEHEGPVWDPDEHESRRWCRLVTEGLGITADPTDLAIASPREEPLVGGAVVVHPGAAFPARCWPVDRFAAVARWAHDRGHEVVVTGGPDESALADDVRRRAGLPATALLAGRTDLVRLAAEVSCARLVVCGDTGVAHLATAFATPSVLLFGPIPPGRWGPLPDGPHEVLWHGTDVGDPWADRPDPALLSIEVDEVVEAALRVLEVSGAGAPGRTTPASS
jgi:ADP-heptose:LPS heptosyltransferase